MNRFKKYLSGFLCILLLLTLCSFPARADSSSPKHIPRIVSILIDNSGSMCYDQDRWAYTSYALQSFCAMMSESDQLFVTYLHDPNSDGGRMDLSAAGKQREIDTMAEIPFGGGTPAKVKEAEALLEEAYRTAGKDAKYFLVAIADGELDSGSFADEMTAYDRKAKTALKGADFESVFCSIHSDTLKQISGIRSYPSDDGAAIIDTVRTISNLIMGRTEITDFTYSGGTLRLELPYPVFSISVIAQKSGTPLSDVSLAVSRGGKRADCGIASFYANTPDHIVKNPDDFYEYRTIGYPANPPYACISVIDNAGSPMEKGSYSVSVSGCTLSRSDLLVMVEPAVVVGCEYHIGESAKSCTFEELNSRLYVGDTFTVSCGLFEMNPDGSAGAPVDSSVLSPDFTLTVDGKQIPKTGGAYTVTLQKDYSGKDLTVRAEISGYQPLTRSETFGSVNVRPVLSFGSGTQAEPLTVTKPDYAAWLSGEKGVSFSFSGLSDAVSDRLSLRVDGLPGVTGGSPAALGSAVKLDGPELTYAPLLGSTLDFDSLPEQFTVSVFFDQDPEPMGSIPVRIVRPEYRLEAVRPFGDSELQLDGLAGNTAAFRFTALADYDRDGVFEAPADCDGDFTLTLSADGLPGETSGNKNTVTFVPRYDPAAPGAVTREELLGKDFTVGASLKIAGQTMESEKTVLRFCGISYRIVLTRELSEELTLDSLKTNDRSAAFRLEADYGGKGRFEQPRSWDTDVCAALRLDSGGLPGVTSPESDGIGFTPLYDENDNHGVVYTQVAGRTHTVRAFLAGNDTVFCETEIRVKAPEYAVAGKTTSIRLFNTQFLGNTKALEFTVTRDGKPLTEQELSFLPTEVTFAKKGLAAEVSAAADGSGAAYLRCVPVYDGWKFLSPKLWNGIYSTLFLNGDTTLTLTTADKSASGSIEVQFNPAPVISMLIALAILAMLVYFIICLVTRVRFKDLNISQVTINANNGKIVDGPVGKGSKRLRESSMKRLWHNYTMNVRKKARSGGFLGKLFCFLPTPYSCDHLTYGSYEIYTKATSSVTGRRMRSSLPFAAVKPREGVQYRKLILSYDSIQKLIVHESLHRDQFMEIAGDEEIQLDYCKNQRGTATVLLEFTPPAYHRGITQDIAYVYTFVEERSTGKKSAKKSSGLQSGAKKTPKASPRKARKSTSGNPFL